MSIGTIFLVIAAILFFFIAVGGDLPIPSPQMWGMFFLALGLLTGPIVIPWNRA